MSLWHCFFFFGIINKKRQGGVDVANVEFSIQQVLLETERLILRPWTEADLPDFYAYARVEGVGEAAGWPHHRSMEESRAILQRFIAEGHVLAVVSKQDGKAIGSLGFHDSDLDAPEFAGKSKKEIGYVLSQEYWGKGLMTEAVRRAIQFCFEDLKLDMVTCSHFMENDRSRRVIEKCGFLYHSDGIFHSKPLEKDFPARLYFLLNPHR